MEVTTIRNLSRMGGLAMASALAVFLVMNHTTPLGISVDLDSRSAISDLKPSSRVSPGYVLGEVVSRQTEDIVYFDTKIQGDYDLARVKVTFQNSIPSQEIYAGFRDREEWHYKEQLIHSPLLDSLSGWTRTGQNPVLYQRYPAYGRVASFLSRPPTTLIGSVNFSAQPVEMVPDVDPTGKSVVQIPLRGKHTLYTYIHNQPFVLRIIKKDLNWYEGADPLTVKIYKGDILAYESTFPDDGIISAKRLIGPGQEIEVRNPGPGLPENGVYKIVLDTGGDVLINRIEAEMGKLVFEKRIYPANGPFYQRYTGQDSEAFFYSNSKLVNFVTNHLQSRQLLRVGEKEILLDQIDQSKTVKPDSSYYEIYSPLGDIIVTGEGFFAFEKSSYFSPIKLNTLALRSALDLEGVDYVLSGSYKSPVSEGDWKTAEVDFDLEEAVIKNGTLSWIIKAPGLKEKNRQIYIKDISVKLIKYPFINLSREALWN